MLALEKFFKTVPKDKMNKVNKRVISFLNDLQKNKYNHFAVSKGHGSKKLSRLPR
ncbi:MAG: hypothetical protein ABGX20_11090 [Bacillus sp. (in: firmicutes)]